MPNWCSNRMYFSGEPAQIAEIKRLASGAVTPLYRRATNEGIQLFLAGSAGLLQITENIRSEQCPGVTAAGRGAVSLENIAFTRWLTHLQNGVLLDEQNCLMLHELWLQSGTGQRRWEGLPDDVRETITVHFTAKRGDWCDIWGNEDVSVWWNRLCDNVLPEKTMPFDLLTVLPTRLDIEVNGFTGFRTTSAGRTLVCASVCHSSVFYWLSGQSSLTVPDSDTVVWCFSITEQQKNASLRDEGRRKNKACLMKQLPCTLEVGLRLFF